MNIISKFSFHRRIIVAAFITMAALTSQSFAEQFDAPKKARRVSNRHISIVNEVLEDAQENRNDYDESQFDAEFAEDAPVVVQASCKNCSSTDPSNGMMSADYDSAAESFEAYPEHGGNEYLSSGCDGGSCFQSFCGSQSSCGINPCSPFGMLSQRLYIRAESATFWGSGQQLPTLVRTGVTPLFGGGEVGSDSVSGFRSETGLWLDDYKSRAIVVRAFYGGDNDVGLVTNHNVFPNLDMPFLSVLAPPALPIASSLIIAQPSAPGVPLVIGNVNANLSSNVYGGDLLFRHMLARDSLGRWDWLMGYQTARLSESLTIDSARNSGPQIELRDSFHVKNQFHGATFGFSGDVREGNWYFGGIFKLGLGNMQREVNIQGNQIVRIVGQDPVQTPTGFYASSRTNSGRYVFDTFVISPELNLTAGYRLTRKLDFTIGYNMLRLPKVTRVANALDPRLAVDVQQIPTQLNPGFVFSESNFTLHSLNLGLQWNY